MCDTNYNAGQKIKNRYIEKDNSIMPKLILPYVNMFKCIYSH